MGERAIRDNNGTGCVCVWGEHAERVGVRNGLMWACVCVKCTVCVFSRAWQEMTKSLSPLCLLTFAWSYKCAPMCAEATTSRQIPPDGVAACATYKENTDKVKPLCWSLSPLLAHPLIPLCCLYSSSFFSFFFLASHFLLKDIIPWLYPLTSFIWLTPPLPFLYICLLVSSVSLWFFPPCSLSLFSPTHSLLFSFVLLLWQLYRTFLSGYIFLFFCFRKKKKYTFNTGTKRHTQRKTYIHLHAPPLPLSLSFFLLPFMLSLCNCLSLQGNELVIFMMKLSLNYSLFLFRLISLAHKMTLILSVLPM